MLDGMRAPDAARVVGETAADTIYAIDRVAEADLVGWLERNWPVGEPAALVTEGIDDEVAIGRGPPRWTLIVDPVDGTRGLMHDKRPAWALAAVAPHGGTLRDVVAAAMTELPTSKQWASDQISGTRDGPLVSERRDVRAGGTSPVALQTSRARDLRHGWASFARFLPAGKAMVAAFEESLWRELYGDDSLPTLAVFDDQYLTSGGQFYELIAGHDRMLGDVRPLAFAALGIDGAIASHPYDCCTAMLVELAGGIVTDPWGDPLDVPLDITTPVAWVGFANPAIAAHVRPALDRALARHFPR